MTEELDLRYHLCLRSERRELIDARGIFCTFVCDKCEALKRTRFRPEIFSDPNYEHSEPIDDDDDPLGTWHGRNY
jgi:hypothetical protein